MIIRVLLALALSAPPVMSPGGVEKSACPVVMPDHTTCGFLVVPERRDTPGKVIKVGYAVHASTAKDRKPDPVVYMSGGPASASMQLTGFLSQMFPDRDVVAVEQRGSKYSQPTLGCPETAEAMLDRLREPSADVGAAALKCRERLAQQGVDLRGYNTKEIAADVVELRKTLGYPTWNLFGVSYSTRVMMDVAAADPAGVRSVVLDSYLPEKVGWYDDADRNLTDTVTKLGLREPFEAMVTRLNARPARVPTTDPLLGTGFAARLTGDDVSTIMAEALHEADVLAVAPAMIDALSKGDDELLRPLADEVGDALVSHEFGLYHAVQCQDEVPFNTFTTKSRLFTVNSDKAVCDAWKLPKSAPVNATTKAPVLVVGGQYDPTTPTRTSEPAAKSLPNARFVEFAGTGHAVFLVNGCARRHILAFVDTPSGGAAAPCSPEKAAVYPRLNPGDVRVTGASYQISLSPWLAAPFALFALVSLVQLVAGALKGRAVAAFAGLAGTAFTGLAGAAVWGMLKENETALAVGLPASVWPYTWVAVGSAVLTLGALALRRGWPQAVAAVTAAGFLVWWFAWIL
ncbi:alpha/beta fold hydrolase [Nonomuraea aurantiaca]|uniref:alpha/beta fold hydrolase n=1 Tax=Nonomuraea aurantiaca TaxID=2878562 RepID=UPI001CD98B17|nr:alpha/beta hydrolase [Nonomuraea aurantiaca]MCA2220340.1 alpha/beta hydrolase [Nonomuraea aurantiaca]